METEGCVGGVDGFLASVSEAAARFKALPRTAPVRIISHIDADGISACATLIKALLRESRLHAVRVVQNLNETAVKELAREEYPAVVFVDLGSGQLNDIVTHLKGKQVFILDHHPPQPCEVPSWVMQVNPHLFGMDGGSVISGSGVAWLFARALNAANGDMAHIALIGMLGDMQSADASSLNRSIVEAACSSGKVSSRKGLRLFGMQTRPLHKVLEYSTDPLIPGVSGSESGAIQFLKQLGIKPKDSRQQWRRPIDLSEEEMGRLATGIVLSRLGDGSPVAPVKAEDVIGDIYLLEDEEEGTSFRDAKEFATVLNACGRMDRASVGIGACLGDKAMKRAAMETVAEYRHEIMNALRWVERNRGSGRVHEGKGYVIINAGAEVPHTIIGTVASILSKGSNYPAGTFILSLAETRDSALKASLRASGDRGGFDLREVVQRMTARIPGAMSGGHRNAAGALIPQDAEKEFLAEAHAVLAKHALEERVV